MTDGHQPHQPPLFAYDERREQARALRRAGVPVSEIRERLGIETEYRALSLVADIPAPHPKFRARAKDQLKERARELRGQGWTYPEIAQELDISKSTCSLWLRDLPAPARRPRPPHRPNWEPYRARVDQERLAVKARASEQIGEVSTRELFLIGVALYWAEGTKDKPYRRTEVVTFVNSDPAMIRVFMAWLRVVGVATERCGFRVHIHETADAIAAVRYWATVVGVDPADFRKTVLKRHNPRTNRHNRLEGYHGCLVVRVQGGAALYRRIDGWWQGLSGGVSSQAGTTRWDDGFEQSRVVQGQDG